MVIWKHPSLETMDCNWPVIFCFRIRARPQASIFLWSAGEWNYFFLVKLSFWNHMLYANVHLFNTKHTIITDIITVFHTNILSCLQPWYVLTRKLSYTAECAMLQSLFTYFETSGISLYYKVCSYNTPDVYSRLAIS